MSFRITGLSPDKFEALWALSDEDLATRGAVRTVVGPNDPVPDRIGLSDVPPGETVLLVNHCHQPAATPYRATHAIYVRRGATRYEGVDTIAPALATRTLSLRGFDAAGMLREADLVEGRFAALAIEALFADPEIAYIQAHYAKPGCFAAQVDRL